MVSRASRTFISTILILAFMAGDCCMPGMPAAQASSGTALQAPTIISSQALEGLVSVHLENALARMPAGPAACTMVLTPRLDLARYAGVVLEFDFTGGGKYAEGRNVVATCRVRYQGKEWRCEAVIGPDASFALRRPARLDTGEEAVDEGKPLCEIRKGPSAADEVSGRRQVGKRAVGIGIAEHDGHSYLQVAGIEDPQTVIKESLLVPADDRRIPASVHALAELHPEQVTFLIDFLALLETSPPAVYTFTERVRDLFGCAIGSSIAVHSFFADHHDQGVSALAFFHETAEYLAGLEPAAFTLRMDGEELTVVLGGKRFFFNVSAALANLRAENDYWSEFGQDFLNHPRNRHYLLRVLQRQLFPDEDRELSAQIVARQQANWWRDPKATHAVVSMPISALRRPGPDDPGIGKYTDLAPYFRNELAPYGIDVMLLLPHYAILGESPYATVSRYALNEDNVDWSAVTQVRRHPEAFAGRLAAPSEDIEYLTLRARERAVAMDAYRFFLQEDVDRGTVAGRAYARFRSTNARWLADYCEFMAIHEILGTSSVGWTDGDLARARVDARYHELAGLHAYTQWLAYMQFEQALRQIHAAGGRVLFDDAMFYAKDSVEVWKHRGYFRDVEGSYPGIVNGYVNERWMDLALWNWGTLRGEGYRFMLDPVRYWLRFGFDGGRKDALHFSWNFGGGQLASGDEPGDEYVAALAAVFQETESLPVAEAFEGRAGAAEYHGFIAIDHNWKRLSTHDDHSRWYNEAGVDLMFGLNGIVAEHVSPRASKFIMHTIGDLWGDTRTVKTVEITLASGETFRVNGYDAYNRSVSLSAADIASRESLWRYRIPMPGDADYGVRARYDLRPYLRYRMTDRQAIRKQKKDIWAAAADIVPTFRAAADSFVKHVRGTVEIWAASRDWFFEQWGRDTFISFTGTLLVNGRYEEAREVLRSFARYEKDGIIPNRITDPANPEYNTVDGSLWFLRALKKYADYSGDRAFVREMAPTVARVLASYRDGTSYVRNGATHAIGMDQSDGLIVSPAQATWMDADPRSTGAITPRNGKAVEINALWYANLAWAADLAREGVMPAAQAAGWDALAARAKKSFNDKFWNAAESCLYDVIEGDPHGAAIRPNMAFAVSEGEDLLSPERQEAVFRVLTRELLTPYGLRTLSPRDSYYRAHYDTGSQPEPGSPDFWKHKDFAYHQGTVWPWLMGAYIDTLVRVRTARGRDRDEIRAEVRALMTPLVEFLMERGSLPEVFNGGEVKPWSQGEGDAPYELTGAQYPGGTASQAWSVAEALRVLVEYRLTDGLSTAVKSATDDAVAPPDPVRPSAAPDLPEVARLVREKLVSVALTKRTVALVFDTGLGGTRSGMVYQIKRAVEELKKEPAYARFLANVVILPVNPDRLAANAEFRDLLDDADADIFTFARVTKRDAFRADESRLHPTYIDEKADGAAFPDDAYYPLPEIIAIQLARAVDAAVIRDLAAAPAMNIRSIVEDNGALIFALLPNAARLEYRAQADIYERFKEFLVRA